MISPRAAEMLPVHDRYENKVAFNTRHSQRTYLPQIRKSAIAGSHFP